MTQVKGRLPEGLSQHVDGLLAGGTEAEGIMEKLKGFAGSFMGKAYTQRTGAGGEILSSVAMFGDRAEAPLAKQESPKKR